MTTLQEAFPNGEPNWLPTCDESKKLHDAESAFIRTALAQQGELAEQMVSNIAMDYQLRALDICREAKKVSVSLVQRKLGLSYAAAQELCQSIVASGLVPGLPIAPSLIDVMAAAAQPVAQPLTDKRISWLWSESHNDTTDRMAFQVFARAIEAAHGINGMVEAATRPAIDAASKQGGQHE